MTETEFLTTEELVEISGYKHPGSQREWLDKNGWCYVLNAGGRCALGGTPFSPERPDKVRFRPWMPSLDRIDPFGPYSAGNCRLVSAYTNIAINQFGVDQFVAVAREVEKNASKCRSSRGVGNIQFPNLATKK